MDHYLEIRILPDPEFSPSLLMNALYNKLHRALGQLNCGDIGLSFPNFDEAKQKLGERIRFHGTKERIQELMDKKWLTGMHDHVLVGDIIPIPPRVRYAIFSRVQCKSSVDRIRRRQMLRHNLSIEQATKMVPKSIVKRLELPFITMKSSSTDQIFRLFVKQQHMDSFVTGKFNTYGLSKTATVPLF